DLETSGNRLGGGRASCLVLGLGNASGGPCGRSDRRRGGPLRVEVAHAVKRLQGANKRPFALPLLDQSFTFENAGSHADDDAGDAVLGHEFGLGWQLVALTEGAVEDAITDVVCDLQISRSTSRTIQRTGPHWLL